MTKRSSVVILNEWKKIWSVFVSSCTTKLTRNRMTQSGPHNRLLPTTPPRTNLTHYITWIWQWKLDRKISTCSDQICYWVYEYRTEYHVTQDIRWEQCMIKVSAARTLLQKPPFSLTGSPITENHQHTETTAAHLIPPLTLNREVLCVLMLC